MSKSKKKKELGKGAILAIIIIAAAVLIGCLLIASASLKAERERSLELADLYAMRNAELDAQRMFREQGLNETAEFWYDPNTYQLIPVTEEMPDPSGLGTGRTGGGNSHFLREAGKEYAYDEDADYTDRIIRVVVHPDLTCEVTWVPVE